MHFLLILITAFIIIIDAVPINWRIISGSNATVGQFPYMISLSYKYGPDEDRHICGGVIIDEWWILTAAHCIAGNEPRRLFVKVGSISLSRGGTIYPVTYCTFHGDYDPYEITNDVGLVRLSKPITFVPRLVSPIPLNPFRLSGGERVTVGGWGITEQGGSSPDTLQWLETTVVSEVVCQEANEPFPVTPGMMCTLKGIGHGACHGDSGGFLKDEIGLVGIVSWGKQCAKGYPDVYTRISFYFTWIHNTINNWDSIGGRETQFK